MKLLIKNSSVFLNDNSFSKKDILIEDGKINQIENSIVDADAKVVEAEGLYTIPGLFDMHAHLREPGFEYRETIKSGLYAAAAGGFTKVACMANTNPVNDNAAVTKYIMDRASEACGVRLFPVGSITKNMDGEVLSEYGDMKKAGIVAVSEDGKTVMNARLMRRGMEYAKCFDLPVICHCEDTNLSANTSMNESLTSTYLGFKPCPNACEDIIVSREIALAKLTGCQVHITHMSTAGSVELVRQAKKGGLNITCDVTPHHLYFIDEELKSFNTNFKVNPPLRTSVDREALYEGLRDGTVDAIATDHAPHAEREKKLEFEFANPGMIGFETALNVALDLVEKNVIKLEMIPKLMSFNPCKIMNIENNGIDVGACADISIFDKDCALEISDNNFKSKSKNSPFVGKKMKGKVCYTIVDGKIVYSSE
ncbi:MAG: dihydroorotase [Pseudomonadota bacterium]